MGALLGGGLHGCVGGKRSGSGQGLLPGTRLKRLAGGETGRSPDKDVKRKGG